MYILLYAALLVVCFVVLIKGADYFVEGASDLARILKVPAVIIGLTIVAFGTSVPEAGVSIASSVKGMNALSISNVVGSNAFNLLVVIGFCAAIHAFKVDDDIRKRDYPICIIFTIALVIFTFDKKISRIEGLILVAMIISYVILLIFASKRSPQKPDEEEEKGKDRPVTFTRVLLDLLKIALCIAAIYLSSQGIVKSCSYFAKLFGVSDTIIGLTIVALGTSLPELVTSIVASKKGENAIAIGNVVGSNIFNIAFVLGTSASISPVSNLSFANVIDTFVCLGITLICFIFVFFGKKFRRIDGVLMLVIYAGYMVFVFLREFGYIAV